jgi:hypothetical protein
MIIIHCIFLTELEFSHVHAEYILHSLNILYHLILSYIYELLNLYYQHFLDCGNISVTQAQIGNLIKFISFIFKFLCSIVIEHRLTQLLQVHFASGLLIYLFMV